MKTRLTNSIRSALAHIKYVFVPKNEVFGEVGYFIISNPQTFKYTYANWGSRRWEYDYIEKKLTEINIKEKNVVDIGIGLPDDSNFYKVYTNSGCNLFAFDPDGRLNDINPLSDKCTIYKKPADKMDMLKDNSVDVVVVLSTFEHFLYSQFEKTITEIKRVLKKDGHLLITLDLTHKKTNSARWAILEKTMNGLPEKENDLPLSMNQQQLTLPHFLKFFEPHFYLKNNTIYNEGIEPKKLLRNKRWNSYIGYAHLRKK